jgi:hypothetical protein
MSHFGEFLTYVDKYVAGTLFSDMAYKNYDLLWKATDRRLRVSLALCGFRGNELSLALAECATRVRERGYCLPVGIVRQCLLEWHVWRKLNSGEYRKWKYRSER